MRGHPTSALSQLSVEGVKNLQAICRGYGVAKSPELFQMLQTKSYLKAVTDFSDMDNRKIVCYK
jgi:hypothetical protein